MSTTFELSVPEEAQCTLTIAGSIKDMKTLRAQLIETNMARNWPLYVVVNQIDGAIRKAESQITIYGNKT